MEIKRCKLCGSRLIQYRHVLNKPMIEALYTLSRCGGTANIAEINITHNQICNFQKLRYWGLAAKEKESGVWYVTKRGYGFLAGYESVPKRVVTFRGNLVKYEGDQVCIRDFFEEDYWKRIDYIRNSVEDEEGKLFK